MPPAARVGDMHMCPMVTPGVPPVPHVGGPILPAGCPTVLVGFMPAARVTDMAVCVGPPDIIVKGSTGVLIGGLPAARMGDMTAHGGTIVIGFPTVMIGEAGGGGAGGGGAAGPQGSSSPSIRPTLTPDPEFLAEFLSTFVTTASAGLALVGVSPPAHSPSASHSPAPSHAQPCAKVGAGTSANAKTFTKDFKALQKEWPKLTPAQRQTRLEDIANRPFAASGVPRIHVDPENQPGPDYAHMSIKSFGLAVDKNTLDKPGALSDGDAKKFANASFHEARHAEQWYLIARKMAGDGTKPADIQKITGLPSNIVSDAAKKPLAKNAPERACANALYESVYGSGAANRSQVLKQLKTLPPATAAAVKKANDAATKYKSVAGDRNATAADKKKALDEWKAAYQDWQNAKKAEDANYKAYRNLPEEADAWRTGDLVNSSW
jgi:uncharacterized Zn-binding protein involved in type VI secretion